MPSKKNTFPHVKIVMAGFLTTNSLVRSTTQIIYEGDYPSQKARDKAVMAYFYTLGVPNALVFDDFSNLLETVFPEDPKAARGPKTFPISLDYDQDNCGYGALLANAKSLDQAAAG
jgi:hypothetical protein